MVISPYAFVACLAACQIVSLLACAVGAIIYYRGTGRTNPVAAMREKAAKDPQEALRYALVMRKKLADEGENIIKQLMGRNPDLMHDVQPPGRNGAVV